MTYEVLFRSFMENINYTDDISILRPHDCSNLSYPQKRISLSYNCFLLISHRNPKNMKAGDHSSGEDGADLGCAAVVPTDTDVLCGMGYEKRHPGNELFKNVVSQFIDAYAQAQSRSEKMLVTANILDLLSARGIRFLKQSSTISEGGHDADRWYIAEQKVARDKVGNMLRYFLSKRTRSSMFSTSYPPSSLPFSLPERQGPTDHHNKTSHIAQHFSATNFPASVRSQQQPKSVEEPMQEAPSEKFGIAAGAALDGNLAHFDSSFLGGGSTNVPLNATLEREQLTRPPLPLGNSVSEIVIASNKSQQQVQDEIDSSTSTPNPTNVAIPQAEDLFDESELAMRLLMDYDG